MVSLQGDRTCLVMYILRHKKTAVIMELKNLFQPSITYVRSRATMINRLPLRFKNGVLPLNRRIMEETTLFVVLNLVVSRFKGRTILYLYPCEAPSLHQ